MRTFRHWHLIVLFGSLIGVFSCQSGVVYQDHQAVPIAGWHYNDGIVFEATLHDTLSLHELYLDVRNTTDYPYRNLFLFLEIAFPDDRVLRDTIECVLADNRGNWTGSGFGYIRFNRYLFRDEVWFPVAGTYTFTIYQGMRETELAGIADVGIRIDGK